MKRTTLTLYAGLFIFVTLVCIPVLAVTTTTTNQETFESQQTNHAPAGTFYSLYYRWMNNVSVTNKGVIYGNKELNLTSTTGATALVDINVTQKAYTEVTFWFYIKSKLNNASDIKNIITYYGSPVPGVEETIQYITIYNIRNTSVVNVTSNGFVYLSQNTAYRITMLFNWTDGKTDTRIYNKAGALQKDYGWYTMLLHPDNFNELEFSGVVGTSVHGYYDNFGFSYTTTTAGTTTDYLTHDVLSIIIAVAILMAIIGIAFSVGATKEGLITIMLISIIGIIVISIITGL